MLIKSKKPFDYCIVILRSQPFHNAHKSLVESAFKLADEVIAVIGSSNACRSIYNPWLANERHDMIRLVFPDPNLQFVFHPDTIYSLESWVLSLQNKINEIIPPGQKVALHGHKKDERTKRYINRLGNIWTFKPFHSSMDLNATDIRTEYFNTGDINNIPKPIADWIHDSWARKQHEYCDDLLYDYMVEEHETVLNERSKIQCERPYWGFTADAFVTKSYHILLTERKYAPGKGLWALPGGFVKQGETSRNAVIRELAEETGLRLFKSQLRQYIKKVHLFEETFRDVRYRIISNAFHIDLGETGKLPDVKGGSDAKKAFFKDDYEVLKSPTRMYADHFHIIKYFFNLYGEGND